MPLLTDRPPVYSSRAGRDAFTAGVLVLFAITDAACIYCPAGMIFEDYMTQILHSLIRVSRYCLGKTSFNQYFCARGWLTLWWLIVLVPVLSALLGAACLQMTFCAGGSCQNHYPSLARSLNPLLYSQPKKLRARVHSEISKHGFGVACVP